jgi:polysaccharide export outer membrane protein
MRNRRRGLWLATAALCGLCLGQLGCNTLLPQRSSSTTARSSSASANAPVLARGTEVEWTIKSATGPANAGMSARGTVGPDGTLELGPYGSVAVAGLTVPKAAKAVERQVARYLKDPKIYLRVAPPDAPSPMAQARPPFAQTPAIIAQSAPTAAQSPVRRVVQWSSDDQGKQPVAANWQTVQRDGVVRLVGSQLVATPDGPFLEPIGQPGTKDSKTQKKNDKAGTPKTNGNKKVEEVPPPRVMAGAPVGVGPGVMIDPHGLGMPPLPRECNKVPMQTYRVAPPDILLIESLLGLKTQEVKGPHLVRPDGTVGVGIYGNIYVAGLTLDEVREAVARVISPRLKDIKYDDVLKNVSVDVLAYNSQVYYVISDAAGLGDQVVRLPITGNETVLDAIGLNPVRGSGSNGLLPVASKKHIWVARPDCHGRQQILPVDWLGITQRGESGTNYQILPGDRVYVKADCLRTFSTNVDKVLSPIERILGVTLLGSQTVNSIRSGGTTTSVP